MSATMKVLRKYRATDQDAVADLEQKRKRSASNLAEIRKRAAISFAKRAWHDRSACMYFEEGECAVGFPICLSDCREYTEER
jgi:hypothetical protein